MNIDIKTDLWSYLKQTSKTIVMYGMGNGADKILAACAAKGIEVADFFASDGFVRGHSFHGKTVLSYSDVKQKYGVENIIVLLSFASSLPDVLANIYRIAGECELYAPDVPVFGDNLFDLAFFNTHISEFESAYNLLADEKSRILFTNTLKYKLTGDISFISDTDSDKSDIYRNILSTGNFEYIADLGAYNGDTIREILPFAPHLKSVIAFEPDVHSQKKLREYAETETKCDIKIIPACAWSSNTVLEFDAKGGRSAGISSNSPAIGKAAKKTVLQAETLDSVADDRIDYIKYDVEGSEREALLGSVQTIERCSPVMLVSAYHRSEDLYDLPLLIARIMPGCRMYLRRTPYIPAWDLHLLVIPSDVIHTLRMDIIPATDDEMRRIIDNEPDDAMKQAYGEMLDGCLRNPDKRNWYTVWKMVLNDGSGTFIGDLCFKGITDDGMVEIGYGIHPEFEGHGYMTEAVSAAVKWAKEQPGVTRIEAETEPDNAASQRVLEKSGFIPNGIIGEEGPRFIYTK